MSRFKALQKLLGVVGDDAAKVLEKIDNPELATSLKGQERAEYLQALDEVYGNRTTRGFYNPKEGYKSRRLIEDLTKHPSKNIQKLFEEGYTFDVKDDIIKVYPPGENSKEGVHIASLSVKELKNDPKKFKSSGITHVMPEHRRKGIASAMYEIAESAKSSTFRGDAKMVPSGTLLPEGKKLWENPNRPFGNLDTPTPAYINEAGNVRSASAAFDPRFKDSALLMAGGAAIPTTDISPMSAVKDVQEQILNPVVSRYNKLKSYITNPLSKQLDLTKDKSEAKSIKQALDMGLDPVNLIPGGAGLGVSALQMLGEEDEDE